MSCSTRSRRGRGFPFHAAILMMGVLGAAYPGPATAVTHRVPSDIATIGEALQGAGPTDTVLVSPGTYAERLVLPPAVTLRVDGPPGSAILDGEDAGSCVTATFPAPGTRLEGFLLRRGSGTDDGGTTVGGALRVSGGTLLVLDCTFEDSGAIFGGGSAASLSNITFRDCLWRGTTGSFGGGHFQSGGRLVVTGGHFEQTVGARGAGLHVTSGADATIVDSAFEGTHALVDGGGAWFDACVATLSNTRFDRSRAENRGGGIAVSAGGQVLGSFVAMIECEAGAGGGAFHVSCDPSSPGRGSAADCALLSLTHTDVIGCRGTAPAAGSVTGSAVVRLGSSIVAGNTSGLACLDPRSTLDVTCSDLYRNGGEDLSGACEPKADPANLGVDPRLCDLTGRNLALCDNSELLDPGCGDAFWGAAGLGCAACGPTATSPVTWGSLKARYHR